MAVDGFHPGEKAYQYWAEAAYEQAIRLLRDE